MSLKTYGAMRGSQNIKQYKVLLVVPNRKTKMV